MHTFRLFIQQHCQFICIGFILVISIFLHFYLLPSHMHFYGDEATISQIVKEIVTMHRFPTVGQIASLSIGTPIYHGAFFYYILLIPGIFTSFNPLGFGIFTALLSFSSVILLYFSLKEFWGMKLALLTTAIYAFSANVNFYGRWEWNPNIIPFFFILALFSLERFLHSKRYFLPVFFFSIATLTQLHLTGYLFLPILVVLLPILYKRCKDWKVWGISIIAFFIPWSMTIYHEFKTGFSMTKALLHFFLTPSHTSLIDHFVKGYTTMMFLFQQVIGIDQSILILITLASIFLLMKYWLKDRNNEKGIMVLFILLVFLFSFIAYAFYPDIVYIHYGEQLFALFPFLVAIFISLLIQKKELLIAGIFLFLSVIYLNWLSYSKYIIQGDKSYYFENKICNTIKNENSNAVVAVDLNGVENPNFLSYVCDNEYGISLSSIQPEIIYHVSTDYISTYHLSREYRFFH